MIQRKCSIFFLAALACAVHAQFQHRIPMSPERLAERHRREQAYADGSREAMRARKMLDVGNVRSAETAFGLAAEYYGSVPDPSSEAEIQSEWSFESGDYPAVVRLSKKIDQIEGHRDSLLRLAIAECRTSHPEQALPRIAEWRKQEYCETGKIITSDLPVELSTDARSVEATAWLILSYHRDADGRPASRGYLEAQRLAPKNPAIAARLVEWGIVTGDYALARRNLPLTATSKNPAIRGNQAVVAREIDRREAASKATPQKG